MCIYSAINDSWKDGLPQRYPGIIDQLNAQRNIELGSVPRGEFEALKREVEELKKLLHAAKKFDEATGQPDCEMESKVKFLRTVAEFVGVSLEDVLKVAD